MIAENNPILKEASENLYVLNSDELARARAQARKEHILHENALNRKITKLSGDIDTLTSENQELASENQALTSENMTLTSKIQQLQSQLAKHGISDTDN